MNRVDFYLLTHSSPTARYPFACRIVAKAYHLGHKVYIHASNKKEAHTLDELLWNFRDDSFIPHNLYGEGPNPPPPVQIGYDVQPNGFSDILVNFDRAIPEFHQRFNRIIEIVPKDPDLLNTSRDHFRSYRDHSYEINTHNV